MKSGLKFYAIIVGILIWITNPAAEDLPSGYEFIDSLIKSQKYDMADEKLNELLKTNPDNPDALMFKGILIFYRDAISPDEKEAWQGIDSIYEPDFKANSFENSSISPETAAKISGYFNKALKIDPSRMNIQLGLCYAYSKAGMKEELISRLPELKKYSTPADKMQYNMSEYARILARQKTVMDGIDVFNEIIKLYPEDGNIVNDMGVLYFENGMLDESMKYFHQAEKTGNLDRNTLENLMLVYSLTGDFKKVEIMSQLLSSADKNNLNVVYEALHQRLQGDPDWIETLKKFHSRGNDKDDVNLFVSALRKSASQGTFEKMISTAHYNLPAPLLVLNYEWAIKRFPDQFDTLFNYAEFLNFYRHYPKAVEIFKKIIDQNMTLNGDEKEKFNFYYAWALYSSGKKLQAQQYWKKLLSSDDFYRKSAASFFLGRYYYEKKDYTMAKKYLSYSKDSPDKSKYAEFSLNIFNKIKK
ncbi:MAG: hypothetical protein OEV66_00290 [Spirochaetia bacterium]|nr:hypothetical protein [Spirochaetia bacterium]